MANNYFTSHLALDEILIPSYDGTSVTGFSAEEATVNLDIVGSVKARGDLHADALIVHRGSNVLESDKKIDYQIWIKNGPNLNNDPSWLDYVNLGLNALDVLNDVVGRFQDLFPNPLEGLELGPELLDALNDALNDEDLTLSIAWKHINRNPFANGIVYGTDEYNDVACKRRFFIPNSSGNGLYTFNPAADLYSDVVAQGHYISNPLTATCIIDTHTLKGNLVDLDLLGRLTLINPDVVNGGGQLRNDGSVLSYTFGDSTTPIGRSLCLQGPNRIRYQFQSNSQPASTSFSVTSGGAETAKTITFCNLDLPNSVEMLYHDGAQMCFQFSNVVGDSFVLQTPSRVRTQFRPTGGNVRTALDVHQNGSVYIGSNAHWSNCALLTAEYPLSTGNLLEAEPAHGTVYLNSNVFHVGLTRRFTTQEPGESQFTYSFSSNEWIRVDRFRGLILQSMPNQIRGSNEYFLDDGFLVPENTYISGASIMKFSFQNGLAWGYSNSTDQFDTEVFKVSRQGEVQVRDQTGELSQLVRPDGSLRRGGLLITKDGEIIDKNNRVLLNSAGGIDRSTSLGLGFKVSPSGIVQVGNLIIDANGEASFNGQALWGFADRVGRNAVIQVPQNHLGSMNRSTESLFKNRFR